MAHARFLSSSRPIRSFIAPRALSCARSDLLFMMAYTHGAQYPSITAWTAPNWAQRVGRNLNATSGPQTAECDSDRTPPCPPKQQYPTSPGCIRAGGTNPRRGADWRLHASKDLRCPCSSRRDRHPGRHAPPFLPGQQRSRMTAWGPKRWRASASRGRMPHAIGRPAARSGGDTENAPALAITSDRTEATSAAEAPGSQRSARHPVWTTRRPWVGPSEDAKPGKLTQLPGRLHLLWNWPSIRKRFEQKLQAALAGYSAVRPPGPGRWGDGGAHYPAVGGNISAN